MKNGRDVFVAGAGLTRFNSYDGQKGRPKKEFYDLGSEAILSALADADMEWKDIQAAFCGSVYLTESLQSAKTELKLSQDNSECK